MEKLKNNKYFIGIVIISTLVLSAIATITASRLYQLRQEPVAPNVPSGNVYAFSCEEYQMLVDTNGTIRIKNVSGEARPSQEIEIIVGGQSLGSFSIPALDPQTNAEIGGINLPAGDFNWNISGDILCQGNQTGTLHESESCSPFSVSLASAQTLPTSTPTPTLLPGSNPTSTPTPTPTRTPTNIPTSTPTPASSQAVYSSPTPTIQPVSEIRELPDSGSTSVTLIIVILSVSTIIGTGLLLTLTRPEN